MADIQLKDYRQALHDDLPEQFLYAPRIDALMQVLGWKLEEVQRFFKDLHDLTRLQTAEGVNLDRIGDIVVLSRYEAGVLACLNESVFYLEDERYRDYLIFKIWKNTNHTTYADVYKGLRIFWDKPLYYSEDPSIPACMIFDTGEMEGWVDTRPLMEMPIIRAAGVGFRLYARTRTDMGTCWLYIRTGFMTVSEDGLPWLDRDIDYDTKATVFSGFLRVAEDTLPWVDRDIDYTAETPVASVFLTVAEDDLPERDRSIDYKATAGLHGGFMGVTEDSLPPPGQDDIEGLGYSIMETTIPSFD